MLDNLVGVAAACRHHSSNSSALHIHRSTFVALSQALAGAVVDVGVGGPV